MTARGAWELISTTTVAVAAVAMLVLYIRDQGGGVPTSEPERPPVENWRDWRETGLRFEEGDRPMVVATFTDFACPYCGRLAPVLDSLRSAYPGQVAIEIHHFPLMSHELAIPSAMAAECADRQGRFVEMYHALFTPTNPIGSKAWEAFAVDAGVKDIPAFNECMRLPPELFGRITAGRELGERIGVQGTPEVWINGKLSRARTLAAFRSIAAELGLH